MRHHKDCDSLRSMSWELLPIVGLAAGLIAGIFGLGGGVIVVPAVFLWATAAGVPSDLAIKLALGSSLASILFTGSWSAFAHHRHGAVRWDLIARLAPGLLLGAAAAGSIAHRVDGSWLQAGFGLFIGALGLKMLIAPGTPTHRVGSPVQVRGLPLVGGLFGLAAALAGIGGGALVGPFLSWRGLPVREAVASAAAAGPVIAVSGAASYTLAGWGLEGLPPGSTGYLVWPVVAAVVLGSLVAVPAGAWLAHRLPERKLELAFGAVALLLGARMAGSGIADLLAA